MDSDFSATSETADDSRGDWRHTRRVLAGLIVMGLFLRTANLTWGIPVTSDAAFYHADEVKSWGSTVDFPSNYLTSENYLYGTAVQYLVGLLLLPVKFIYFQFLSGSEDKYILIAVLVFRVCVAAMGTATIALTYSLGRRLFDEKTALVAAAFLTFAPSHCWNSGLTTLDVPMGFLLTASLLVLLRSKQRPRPRNFLLLGIVTGLLMGTKVTGFLFFPVPIVFFLMDGMFDRRRTDREGSRRFSIAPTLGTFALTAVATYALTTPHAVLSLGEFLDFMQNQKSQWYDRSEETVIEILAIWFRSTANAAGYVAAILVPAFALTIRPPERLFQWMLAFFCLAYYLFWGSYLPPRFLLFVTPLLCLQAAAVCNALGRRLPMGALLVVVFGCAVSFATTLIGIHQKWNDTRTLAKRYLEQTFPEKTTVGVATDSHAYDWRHHQWRYPPIDFEVYREVHFLNQPEVVVTTSYELDLFREVLQSEKLQDGYRWDPESKGDWYQYEPPRPEVFRFYEGLLAEESYELLRIFRPAFHLVMDGESPTVYVYQKRAK